MRIRTGKIIRIGGFVPFSLTDYPGEIAAICFTQGCNFSCPFCHNRSLIPYEPFASGDNEEDNTEEIFEFLARRKGRLGAVVVTGGEPTLQKDLPVFLAELRSLGYRIKLDTNGSRPAVLEILFGERLLDLVAMDIKAPWEKYGLLAGKEVDTENIQRSLRLILDSGVRHIFRTTFVPDLLNQEDLKAIRHILPPHAEYVVQPYRKPPRAA